jgi:hypothetical protein
MALKGKIMTNIKITIAAITYSMLCLGLSFVSISFIHNFIARSFFGLAPITQESILTVSCAFVFFAQSQILNSAKNTIAEFENK